MKTVEVEITAETFVMGTDAHQSVKAGDRVKVSERDAAHLVAVGKAQLVEAPKA